MTSRGRSSTPRVGSTSTTSPSKVVAVVGTGSSATQIVPAIQPIVQRLYVFQREPGWVLPKGERELHRRGTCAARASVAPPMGATAAALPAREEPVARCSCSGRARRRNAAREEVCHKYIARQFAEHPELREAVTPRYPYPGKRPMFASTFYPALEESERGARSQGGRVRDAHRGRRRRRRRTGG